MEELHHHFVHGGVGLETPLFEDSALQNVSSFAAYQQLPNSAGPSMSWSTTDPTLFVNEQTWLNLAKAPSMQTDLTYFHQGLPQVHGGYGNLGTVDMMAALSCDPHAASMNEFQLLQLYSHIQEHYGDPVSSSFMPDSMAAQPYLLTSSASECLQVVSSSGSDNVANDSWRSETAGSFASNYENMVADLNESFSVASVRTAGRDRNLHTQKEIDVMDQEIIVRPPEDSWLYNQVPADAERNSLFSGSAVSAHATAFDVLPSSSTAAGPPFRRQRTWYQALEQGSSEHDRLQQVLASKTNRKLEFSAGPLSRPIARRDIRIPGRQAPLQGKQSSVNSLTGPGSSASTKRIDDGRVTGKVNVTSVEPQSVAARHRRKKISERIRVLEKLIPGGNKMDTATMLDEAIEYVKFLQLQVQILESESLGDMPVTASNSTQSLSRKGCNDTGKGGLKRKIGCDVSSALSLRSAASPLILSEVLQQQLFKQKLCLVSISQCPPPSKSASSLLPAGVSRK